MIVTKKQVFLQKLTSAAHLLEFIQTHNCPLMAIYLINPEIYSAGCRLRISKMIKISACFIGSSRWLGVL